jgi:hypothetical protein
MLIKESFSKINELKAIFHIYAIPTVPGRQGRQKIILQKNAE